jgi:hypothetical protein
MLQIYESEHVQGELRKATAKCGSECNVHLLAPMSGYMFFKELRKRLLRPMPTPQLIFVIVNDKYLEAGGNHWTLRCVGLGMYAGNATASALPMADVVARPVAMDLTDDEREHPVNTRYNTVALPKEVGGGSMWTQKLLALLNAGLKVSNDRLERVKRARTSDRVEGAASSTDEGETDLLHLFDVVAICYEEGEARTALTRDYKWYLGRVERIYRVPEKGGQPKKYFRPVDLGEKDVYIRVKLFTQAPPPPGRTAVDRTCFILGGSDVKDDCDAVKLSAVLAKVSLRCQEEEVPCSGIGPVGIGTTTTQLVYYLSKEQYRMVTNLTGQIAASVKAPTTGAPSDDEQEASADRDVIAQQRKRTRKAAKSGTKAAKVAEAERVRNVIVHEHECAVNERRGDYTPPLGWVVSDKAAVTQQVQHGLLEDNFLKDRKFIQRFGVEWFEGTVIKRGDGRMCDYYHVEYLEKDGKKKGARHKCVAAGYGRLASSCWCLIEKEPRPKGRRKTLKMAKDHYYSERS